MPPAALALVLVAAVTHATWNLLAKRAATVRNFVFLYSAMAVALWTPAVAFVPPPALDGRVVVALVGTAAIHLAYSLMLQYAYSVADLSLVYPVIRGTGPLLAFVGAACFLGEVPTPRSLLGAGLVVAGVFLLTGGRTNARGAAVGVATGGLVAGYTVWDAWAVKTVGVPPLWVDYAGNVLRVVTLAPRALRDRAALAADLRAAWFPALAVAVLGPLGYILVLTAVTLAPVSHVAPARELSMLVAAWLGGKVLHEGDTRRRLVASGLLVGGVVCLASA